MNNFNLTQDEVNILGMFFDSVQEEKYDTKLSKKVFKILVQEKGIRPFKEFEKPSAFSSVIPLFRFKEQQMEQYASGVLLEIAEVLFLLTAAHVVRKENNIFVPTKDEIKPIKGICRFTLQEDCSFDNIDFAYIKIENKLAKELKDYFIPLTQNDIDLSDIPQPNDFYVFTGYPYRKSKNIDNMFETDFFEYVGPYTADKSIYDQKHCDIQNNIIIRFNLKQTTTRNGDNLKAVVSPEGISGGGVFSFSKDKKRFIKGDSSTKLVGIAHEHDGQKKIFIGTSILFCLNYIANFESEIFEYLFGQKDRTKILLGFAYYKKNQWINLKNIATDGNTMANEWEQWRDTLENGRDKLLKDGISSIRVLLDLNEMLEYCTKHKKPLNSKTRTAIVTEKMTYLMNKRLL